MYFQNKFPTIDEVLKVVNNEKDIPNICQTTFYNTLNQINFRYVKWGWDSALTERNNRNNVSKQEKSIVHRRNLGEYRYTKSHVWKDKAKKTSKEKYLTGLSTGNKATGKRSGLIITHKVTLDLLKVDSDCSNLIKQVIITQKWMGITLKTGSVRSF